jgi:signal transduction histidine kinase
MRTPLTIISVNVQVVSGILQRMGDALLDERVKELLADAQSEIIRLSRMVEGMLTLASISEGGERRKTDLSALLYGVMDLLRIHLQESGNEPETEIEEGLTIFGDADLISQVVINLIQNSEKHTINGTITLKAAHYNGEILVQVTDNGTGISPELLSRLFERGVSDGGTGFGLNICKTVVESHGGRIWINSNQLEPDGTHDGARENGTTVFFTLPFYEGQFGGEPE